MFDDTYYEVLSLAKSLLNANRNVSVTPSQPLDRISNLSTNCGYTGDSSNIQGQVKLPNISLPDFSGHFSQWVLLYTSLSKRRSIVLNWIAAEPITWNTYVANRVTEIQELRKTAEWRYVPSLQNPADIVSRGRNPLKLMESEMWWYGPEFLREDWSCWPEQQRFANSETLEKRYRSGTFNL
ncbi:hypothetical protein Trydic_g7671 [Trypoxylus dichotomus]